MAPWLGIEVSNLGLRGQNPSSYLWTNPLWRKVRDSNPQTESTADCFQDSSLVQPDTFHIIQLA